jgi:hypothetical protein
VQACTCWERSTPTSALPDWQSSPQRRSAEWLPPRCPSPLTGRRRMRSSPRAAQGWQVLAVSSSARPRRARPTPTTRPSAPVSDPWPCGSVAANHIVSCGWDPLPPFPTRLPHLRRDSPTSAPRLGTAAPCTLQSAPCPLPRLLLHEACCILHSASCMLHAHLYAARCMLHVPHCMQCALQPFPRPPPRPQL